MTDSVFAYPGGKTYLSDWIVSQIPDHECYVEPFCGSASVLLAKPRSSVEVINDIDGDVVQFFEVLRDHPDELVEWLRSVPYARDVHEEWATAFYNGERPDDPVERAGRFFYLRYSQFAAWYGGTSGFAANSARNEAQKFANGRENLRQFADRFESVAIENRDYTGVIETFDSEETVFYLDPPYLDRDRFYQYDGQFDHDRFVGALASIEGDWLVSYMGELDLKRLHGTYVITADTAQKMNHAYPDGSETRTEQLVMNFDPSNRPAFSGAEQRTLAEVTGDD